MDNFLKTLEGSPVWERFNQYFDTINQAYPFDFIYEPLQLAALVDWLDTEGVYVEVKILYKNWEVKLRGFNYCEFIEFYPSRSEATKAGIIKAFSLLEKKI